ncbi:MAG: PHP domain-containing protein, partial [Candidatus Omnitrophica bacterium]|nr:PHP domain-containing protein [Candidatus Omnitrophota bacterium]
MSEITDNLCDLHIHSKFSDSDLTVENIFKQAKEKSLRCIALTDHDTVGGVNQARICSREYGVELIEAIELSAQHQDVEVHVLGYFIDSDNPQLSQELEKIKLLRRSRLIEMADILASLGLNVDSQELMAKVGDTIPTRLHLALYLLNKGIVTSLYEAFRKYLSPGKPAYR